MAHTGEPVGDAGALLGDLLEDSGPSVADDVVVALHVAHLGADLSVSAAMSQILPSANPLSDQRARHADSIGLVGGAAAMSQGCCVEHMPPNGAETERLQALLRDFRRVDL